MRRRAFAQAAPLRALTTAFCLALASGAFAEPRVVPGIGEREAARLFAAPPAPIAAPEPAPAAVAAVSPGAYGGGFIELLVTGSTPSHARRAPQAQAPAHMQLAAYAPPQQANVQREIEPVFQRAEVDYGGGERPGTIVVDSDNKLLYYVLAHGRAMRYGIGVGRPGFTWTGVKPITRKAQWPDWTPPAEMLARRPDLPRHMAGGPANPLGARALYLGGSLYRIHGTNEPTTIGQNVSSGCIRMMNEDVVDLYDRVHVGTRVVVR
ncbi:L,D-transpeptidase [Methylosinus sp. Sm6]|uniref:L,D-transpeptidase n=1 Tax=Methylosinus sp. Sm6 TaxID=2866948 RepID=UPI001C9974AC|nr:L,D-transpeptidase [Methylosinus sp. Sm6]MBY6240752.1 L,D-transpeptidase [Methylosinus sp. Sm6]